MSFTTRTFGKWILAGEHSVLRGTPALVFPATNFSMSFCYRSGTRPIQAAFSGPNGEELKLIFWGLMEAALEQVERPRSELRGEIEIGNTIPLGAGLGASAALCVGVARWFAHKEWISEDRIYEFARRLEGLFHGESSGVDIAVALEGCGLRFTRGPDWQKLTQKWQPHFYLSYSGHRGVTSECVQRVKDLWARAPELGDKIDGQMNEAVEMAEMALQQDENAGFISMAHAMDLARDCFYQWGLCEGALDQHIRQLTSAGAMAVKPTGSGGGGYVLSLWRECPPSEWLSKLVRV